MTPDAAHLVALRTAKMLTQEQLAAKSKLNVRTIQRLEKGLNTDFDTLNMVSAPLGVMANELVVQDWGASPKSPGIILKPELSIRGLVGQVIEADRLDFDLAFEPRRSQVEASRALIAGLEELNCYMHESAYDYDGALRTSAARRIEVAANLNDLHDALGGMQPEGLHLLSGTYNVMGKKVRWNVDEGCWFTSVRQREEPLIVVAVRIAPKSMSTMWIPTPEQREARPSGGWDAPADKLASPDGGDLEDGPLF